MNSIRKRLLLYILSLLALGALAVCISTYLGIRHEMDELYDANMRQLARTVSSMPLSKGMPDAPLPYSDQWPRGEEVFLIQIWENGKLDYTSHPIADFPLQENKGHGQTFFRGKKWGYYQEDINGHVVQVSQELKMRREVIREVYNAVIIPILIMFPLLGIFTWFFVGYGFRPLLRLSDLIQKRTATFMAPIEPKDTPQEIKALVIALNDLLYRLKISLETQRQFTADAAHELRTPLTAVRLQLDLLQRADKPDDRKDAVETLERGVNRSIRLVQQLLELARQEPENTTQEFLPVKLDDIVRAVTEDHAPLADKKSISLRLELNDVKARGNQASLNILIGNLLTNAISYTNEGGNVLVKTYLDNASPVFEIADDGIGIAPENYGRVFDRFYRVVGTGANGSGLGLSIVKAIAEKHRAEIEISKGLNGKGTSFRIIFPPLSLA